MLVTNVKKDITSLWLNSNIFFTGIYRCCSNIYNIFIKNIILWNTFKIILPRNGCIWINRIFTLAMEKKLQENARWKVNKTIRCLVRNKIKHRKKYKIGKSPTPYPWCRRFPYLVLPPVLDSIFLLIKNISIFLIFIAPMWHAGKSHINGKCKMCTIQ